MKLMMMKQMAKMQMNPSSTGYPVITIGQVTFAIASGVMLFQRNALVLVRELVILPHRIPRPVLRQEDPAQVRMVRERDAVHVVGLALVPVGRLPDRDEAGHRGIGAVE